MYFCSEIYRQGKLGDCLVEALDELIKNEKISPDLAYKVLSEVSHSHLIEENGNRKASQMNYSEVSHAKKGHGQQCLRTCY